MQYIDKAIRLAAGDPGRGRPGRRVAGKNPIFGLAAGGVRKPAAFGAASARRA